MSLKFNLWVLKCRSQSDHFVPARTLMRCSNKFIPASVAEFRACRVMPHCMALVKVMSLSPLGTLGREFAKFTTRVEGRVGGRGIPYAPIAIVLERAHGFGLSLVSGMHFHPSVVVPLLSVWIHSVGSPHTHDSHQSAPQALRDGQSGTDNRNRPTLTLICG